MKKITVIIFCLMALYTQAQNTFPASGNVGIGTTSPQNKLHIASPHLNIYTGCNLFDSSRYTKNSLTVDGNADAGYSTLRVTSSHSGVSDRGLLNVDRLGESYIYVRMDGNVGIGTINPQNKLHVASPHFNMYTGCDLSGKGGYTKNSLTVDGNADAGYSTLRVTSRHSGVSDRGLLNVDRLGESYMYVRMDGNVGIGTSSPMEKFSISGGYLGINGFGLDGSTYQHALIGANATGGLLFEAPKNSLGNNLDIQFNWRGGGIPSIFVKGSTANVGIGTTNPTHKLSVNGTIQAKEIVVNTGWSDFVFDNNYKLRPLTEVEQFVKTNKHLPEIPSQKEVEKNGVQLGDISSKLLMKIEELTLYMIEMKKENEKQKAINVNLENQIKKLQNK